MCESEGGTHSLYIDTTPGSLSHAHTEDTHFTSESIIKPIITHNRKHIYMHTHTLTHSPFLALFAFKTSETCTLLLSAATHSILRALTHTPRIL
jgi:hypothetical protein